MTDPIAEVVSLLKPRPSISKLVTGGGQWLVERTELGSPFYCAVVEGHCRMTITGREPMLLTAGDFVLVPEIFSFTMSSLEPPPRGALAQRLETSPGVFRLGDPEAPAEIKAMVGHCAFGSDDKALLVSLLPEVIHVRGEERLMMLVRMINDETRADRTAREMVLHRLLEVLLIEALRSTGKCGGPAGSPARHGRSAAGTDLAPDSRRSRPQHDGGNTRAGCRHVPFDLLRSFPEGGWRGPDGIRDRLAYGAGEGIPSQGCCHGGDRATRRLWLGKRLQRRVQSACGNATRRVFAGKHC
jgi:hypothetical protein